MNREAAEKIMERYEHIESRLRKILDNDPKKAIDEARQLRPENDQEFEIRNTNQIKAVILVDAGSLIKDDKAIKEGMSIFEQLYAKKPTLQQAYNLTNSIIGLIGSPPHDANWLDYQEKTRHDRNKIRQYFWKAAEDKKADNTLKSTAWTNIGNQFAASYRYGDAQDAWFFALKADPENAVAAGCAAQNLCWLYNNGMGSEVTIEQIKRLCQKIRKNRYKITDYTNLHNAKHILKFAEFWDKPSKQQPHKNPFVQWVIYERLALAPTLEAINPNQDSLDWLCLPSIKVSARTEQPSIFSMFNTLKSDFILARYLTWRALDREHWSDIKGFASTHDGALYGADISALTLAHRSVLDILDKIAILANNYFKLGENINKISFNNLWRKSPDKKNGERPLKEKINDIIRDGVHALYGLVELAGDYNSNEGILNTHKNIRNTSTHRFVILHEYLYNKEKSSTLEIKRFEIEKFQTDVLQALRIARSALQTLVFSIKQNEEISSKNDKGGILDIEIPDFRRP